MFSCGSQANVLVALALARRERVLLASGIQSDEKLSGAIEAGPLRSMSKPSSLGAQPGSESTQRIGVITDNFGHGDEGDR
jgi:hypothetical protein